MTQERTSWLDKKWKEKTKKGERTERQNKTKSGEEEKKKEDLKTGLKQR